ncbi:sodium pump decarboxylases, gamma subunit [Butyrivibrio sp. INlla18]|uniref:OadG family transporter subunit n=1 Tax=Butyrivibrio sp. INlla18 TaxID=1520806 RepID=UPI00087E4B30|nr:OadG family transporter subunit [Butyrivibrio sp. INlla18]SDA78319.1 sodium pump decarboxylases, gamma subunit [Butyrivibrio sp. INlla18]
MKRKFLVLGVMLSCLLSLSACGAESQSDASSNSKYPVGFFNQTAIENYAHAVEDNYFENWYLDGVTPENFEDELYVSLAMDIDKDEAQQAYYLRGVDESQYLVYKSGYTSWYKALKELGYGDSKSLADNLSISDVSYSFDKDGKLVVDATIQGTKHSAIMKIYLNNEFEPTDIGVTINKTTGERLENAGLNTLLGMGMAFAILIIISLIISLFPIFFGGKKKKKESDKEITKKAMDNTINQIAEQEGLSGDAELVAVIAAAIAAYEGSASTDGFQVRSIRKVSKNWKR